MSDFNELMNRLCPNGVKHMQLQEIFDISRGSKHQLLDRKFKKLKTVPWFKLSDICKNGSILNDAENQVAAKSVKDAQLLPANSIIVSTSARTGKHAHITVPHLLDENLVSLAIKPDFTEQLDIRFANYFCFILDNWCIAKTSRPVISPVDIDKLKSFKFPIPPLPVQKEIIRILDSFANLEMELEAELEARRKQCEYYLNLILTFDETSKNTKSKIVKRRTLGEVGKFVSESKLQKKYYTNDNDIGFIDSRLILNHNDIFANQTNKLLSETEFEPKTEKLKRAKYGDLVIAKSSNIDDNVGKAVAWLGDEEVVVGNSVAVYRHTLVPKFVAYYFRSKHFHKQKKPFITGLIDRWININSISKIVIPVPPLKEQERIVNMLDQLYALVNDSYIGLPAEIAARQKQHRHYLNKILRFKEAP